MPHDWSIEGPFDAKNPTIGSGGFLPSGVAWYRKHFTVADKDKAKRIFVEFDGVMGISDVWIGRRFPSELKVVKDPVTGTMLTFLTSTPTGDSKIYQTHNQWTSDGQWLIFRSGRVRGEAMAVNEKTGEMA